MTITFVGSGTGAAAVNGAVTPGAITGVAAGDLVLIQASIRNTGAGTPNTPTGWTRLAIQGGMAMFGRFWQTGDTMPSVTFSGGVANADTIAGPALAFRGVAPDALVATTTAAQANSSAQNVAYPALNVPGDGHAVVLAIWKQDDASSLSTPASYTAVGLASTTAGDDAFQAQYYRIETTEADLGAASITVTGGASAVSSAIALALHPAAAITATAQDSWPTRVLVSVTGLVDGLDSLRIVRDVGGVETLIRAGSFEATDTSYVVIDAELPFGVPVTYKAIVNGTARYESVTDTYELEGGRVALTDAITGVAVETTIMAWDSKARTRRSSLYNVGGSNIVVMSPRSQFEGDITFYFESATARAQFEQLLTTATQGVIQIRQAGGYTGVDCYVAIVSDQEERYSQDGTDDRREWTVHAVEVSGWSADLEASGFTLQDIADFYGASGTLQDIADDYATLLEVAQADWTP